MDTLPLPSLTSPSVAHLLIHPTDGPHSGRRRLHSSLRWLRALWPAFRTASARKRFSLHIDDIRGQPLIAIDTAESLVDLALPPGTYNVTAFAGAVRRGYTMTLEQGTSVDLYMSLATEERPAAVPGIGPGT